MATARIQRLGNEAAGVLRLSVGRRIAPWAEPCVHACRHSASRFRRARPLELGRTKCPNSTGGRDVLNPRRHAVLRSSITLSADDPPHEKGLKMSRFTRLAVCLAVTTMLSTAASAKPAASKHRIPFTGFFHAVEDSITLLPPDVPTPTLIATGSGSGHAARLGRFTIEYEFEVNLETFAGAGVAEFRGSQANRLETSVEGQGTVPTEDGISLIFETHIVTGGTGKFRGASGTIEVFRVLNVFTGETFAWFDGTIELR